MKNYSGWALVAAFMLFANAAHAEKETWTLKLQHASKVGDVVVHDFEGQKEMNFLKNNSVERTRFLDVAGRFEATVTEIDALGRPVKANVRVIRLKLRTDKKGKLTKGTLVGQTVRVSRLPPKTQVEREDGQAIPKPELDALRMFFTTAKRGETNDKLFGPGKPVGVGDTWGINAELVSKSMGVELGFETAVENISGSIKMVKLLKKKRKTYLQVDGKFKIASFKMNKMPGARGFTEVERSGEFAADYTRPQTKYMKMTIGIDFPGDGGSMRGQQWMRRNLVSAK